MGRALQILTLTDIVEINRRMIAEFGGVFFEGNLNLGNRGSLEHVLEEIRGPIFGHDPHPTVIQKASAVRWRIIANHVFIDGNKRAGMEACRLMLDLNGYAMRIDREVVDMALRIATHGVEFTDFVLWIQ